MIEIGEPPKTLSPCISPRKAHSAAVIAITVRVSFWGGGGGGGAAILVTSLTTMPPLRIQIFRLPLPWTFLNENLTSTGASFSTAYIASIPISAPWNSCSL